MNLRLIHLPDTARQASAAKQWLDDYIVNHAANHTATHPRDYHFTLTLHEQEVTPTARELRLHPELALICDHAGLWLAVNGMKMQPDWVGELPRLQRAGVRSEVLARACLATESPKIMDATAGLGHDGLLLAWCGATVTLVERHPILALLLISAKEQAMTHADKRLQQALSRITLVHAKSEELLTESIQLSKEDTQFDVIYLDPMFPKSATEKKQPLVKKEMQILQYLLHSSDDSVVVDWGDALLPLAQKVAKRVIVKRPKLAEPLSGIEPDHRWVGDACRFDGYFQPHAINIESALTDQDDAQS
ncbi:class I SAM-dependent methyltransferase [Aquirhabdus sp.]|uniref:class I SAM-dependent methyltransferase n=1 Tax=Aquirhabdus sp. TaxID=2824160 RepID=UPI00396C2FC4